MLTWNRRALVVVDFTFETVVAIHARAEKGSESHGKAGQVWVVRVVVCVDVAEDCVWRCRLRTGGTVKAGGGSALVNIRGTVVIVEPIHANALIVDSADVSEVVGVLASRAVLARVG